VEGDSLSEELYERVANAILRGDIEGATKAAEDIVKAKADADKALKEASEAMLKVGDMFDRGEMFLPEVMIAADAMKAAIEVLKPALSELVRSELKRGRFLIGSVEGDVHDIGKGIVATMLEAAGFEVIDLGRDVPMSVFLEKTKELKPDIVGLSALMTVTRENQRVFIEMLKREGMRDKVKVMVGGGATTGEWAERIGADGWGEDAPSAVKKAIELIEKKKRGE